MSSANQCIRVCVLRPCCSASNCLPSADYPFCAKKASTDQLSLRSATQNCTKAARRQSTQCQCPCNVPLCPSREHVHNMAMQCAIVSPWLHVQCYVHACNAFCRRRATSCDVSSRTIRTSEAENTFTSRLPGLDRPSNKLSMSTCLWPHDW